MKRLLKTLTETFGPSGYEDAVRKVIVKEVKPLADEIYIDALGRQVSHILIKGRLSSLGSVIKSRQ